MNAPLALITGAASGIGAVVAQRFAARGYEIIVVERTTQLADVGAASLSSTALAVQCDLSDRDQVADLCTRIEGEWADRLEVVIANAGIGIPGDVADLDTDLMHAHIEVNLISVMTMTQAAVRTFVPRGRGHILATVSLGGIAPMPGTAPYAASKAGLRAFLASINAEVHKTGVHVSGINPSAVDTPMLRHEATNGGSMLNFLSDVMSADDIADAYEKAFDKKRLETYVPYSEGVQARIALWRPALVPRFMPLLNRLGERGHKKYLATFETGVD